MPCATKDHVHPPWPKEGTHQLHIEACETYCGWCDYHTSHANNLRAHARRHVRNAGIKDKGLRGISIVQGKAGRGRIVMKKSPESPPAPGQVLDKVNLGKERFTALVIHRSQLKRRVELLEKILRDKNINFDSELAARGWTDDFKPITQAGTHSENQMCPSLNELKVHTGFLFHRLMRSKYRCHQDSCASLSEELMWPGWKQFECDSLFEWWEHLKTKHGEKNPEQIDPSLYLVQKRNDNTSRPSWLPVQFGGHYQS
ncbi:hypothetical protein B0H67DRAFT_146604 [Lasiosphaeris hirsuta]|uniref:C2H2-type domain-containing protein n=1 Tax=Lasiosphaeris hirsuta TaxID=260670 RepID=A0AA40E887_9PEZI|nr:hypothetical protein B0H67DRAFT_146604 [Lasiosphaeris hirsuta]